MKNVLGTNHFTGLDVSKASHLIEDGSLTKSVNGWTDETGAVKVARGQDIMYSGYSAISCFAAGRQAGEDSLVWMDGNNVYKNGSNVGTINADVDNMYIRDFDDNFYIMGSTDDKNYIYDGTLVRQHGPWQADTLYNGVNTISTAESYAVSAITSADPGVCTHGAASIGTSIYITGATEMTEVNNRIFTPVYIDGTHFSISDTSDYTAEVSGATAHINGCGLDGIYRYYVVPTVKFIAEDVVLEGKPRGLLFNTSGLPLDSDATWDAEAVTLSPTDEVMIRIGLEPDYDCSGTVGIDYSLGFRLYRTKADGADYYLEKEWWHGDSDMDLSAGVYRNYDVGKTYVWYSTTQDQDLGAVYLPGPSAHGTPPQSSLMALVGQRLFMNDVSNPQRLYFTGLDGVDYADTLDWLLIPDVITGIGSVGSTCVVFSADRMWRVSMLGGIPDMDEIETSVGTDYGEVMTTTHMGLLFLRKDGLWTTDGSSPPKHVGREAFASINEPTTITAAGDVLYVGDKNTAYIMQDKAGSRNWHEHLVYHTLADATNGRFYAASTTAVYELMAGYRGTATITTKDFTDYVERQITRVIVDYEGSDIPQVLVNGNREGDYDGHPDEGTDRDGNRRLLRFSIPRLHNHVSNVTVTMSGDGVTYGLWMEGE